MAGPSSKTTFAIGPNRDPLAVPARSIAAHRVQIFPNCLKISERSSRHENRGLPCHSHRCNAAAILAALSAGTLSKIRVAMVSASRTRKSTTAADGAQAGCVGALWILGVAGFGAVSQRAFALSRRRCWRSASVMEASLSGLRPIADHFVT